MRRKGKPRGNPKRIEPFQWKPGQSGNPKGRPRKQPLADLLAKVLAEKIPKNQDPRQPTLGDVLMRNWVLEAIKTRDTAIISEIFNRIDGKVKDRVEVGGEDGEPIRIERIDVKKLNDEELAEYARLVIKATVPGSDDGGNR